MQADIVNKQADTDLKREQIRWEWRKAMSVAFDAGVAVASALLAAGAWVGARLLAH